MEKFSKTKYLGIRQIRTNFHDDYILINEFNKNFGDIPWGHKLYNYVNNISTPPVCPVCGKPVKFLKFGRGYYMYCSTECKYKDENYKIKVKNAFIENFGVENPLQSKEVQDKRKKLFLEKYGVDHQSKLPEVVEKRKKTCLRKYGYTTNLLDKDTKEKIVKTNLKKFGVTHQSKSEVVKEKRRKTCLKRFGNTCNLNIKAMKDKNRLKYNNNFIEHVSKLLNIDSNNIKASDNNSYIFYNYCEKHKSFKISRNTFVSRYVMCNIKNFCTKCYPIKDNISIKEKQFDNFIDEIYERNVKNSRKIIPPLEIDIYINEKKIGFEFDGLYWHSNAFRDSNYHLHKTEECEKRGIQLVHIFEDEWIYKNNIVESIIKSKLDIFDNIMHSEDCEIKEIDKNTSKEFLNKNHIQGYINSKHKIGLFYKNELVSIMTFGKKINGNDDEYEMLRFCNKINTNVVGSESILLNHFINTYNPKSIITYVDRRHSNGIQYKNLGFSFVKNTKPNCWYFHKLELIRHKKLSSLAKEEYDPNKTENQIMEEHGLLSIYDCGNIKFELNLR